MVRLTCFAQHGQHGMTVLHQSARSDDLTSVAKLLAAGAEVDALDKVRTAKCFVCLSLSHFGTCCG
jgi:ankyrin repeat protein